MSDLFPETIVHQRGGAMHRAAEISGCKQFRYLLSRRWANGLALTFIMLNPSTADALEDDHTIRKCIGFAKRFGFAGIVVVNLFAYRATDPAELRRAGFPPGPLNLDYLLTVTGEATKAGAPIVCAWGAHARRNAFAAELVAGMQKVGADLRALRILDDGTPAHPLTLPYSCELVPFPKAA